MKKESFSIVPKLTDKNTKMNFQVKGPKALERSMKLRSQCENIILKYEFSDNISNVNCQYLNRTKELLMK